MLVIAAVVVDIRWCLLVNGVDGEHCCIPEAAVDVGGFLGVVVAVGC